MNRLDCYRLYRRYKELWLIIAGFLFTSVVGTGITSYYQSLINERSDRETRASHAREAGMATLQRIAEDISQRHYLSLRMIDEVERQTEPPVPGQAPSPIGTKYQESIEKWNLDWNLMRVLLKRTFSEELEARFYDYANDKTKEGSGAVKELSITGKFRILHREIRAAERATDAAERKAALGRASELYHSLSYDIYGFFDAMALRIQTGDLGENRLYQQTAGQNP